MHVRLRWLVAVPFLVAAGDWVATYLLEHIADRSLGDTTYWGTAVPWVLDVAWYAGVIGFFVAVLLVAPAVLAFRALRRWPVLLGPKTRDTPDQRRAFEQRVPRV